MFLKKIYNLVRSTQIISVKYSDGNTFSYSTTPVVIYTQKATIEQNNTARVVRLASKMLWHLFWQSQELTE